MLYLAMRAGANRFVRNVAYFSTSGMFALAPLSPQVSYPAAAAHCIRGTLAAQAVFELTDVDVARICATFRAPDFVFVVVHRRCESCPVFVDYPSFRRRLETDGTCSLGATERTRAVNEVNVR